jgi:hypothetical protein
VHDFDHVVFGDGRLGVQCARHDSRFSTATGAVRQSKRFDEGRER